MLPQALKSLIEQLSKLPGLGQRSATRMAFYLINRPEKDLNNLAQAIKDLPQKIKTCQKCFNLTSGSQTCLICADQKRNQELICIVEDILDIVTIERTRQYNGVYHVLGGLISPPDGITPDKLRVRELVSRIKNLKGGQTEIILALNPTTEGDTTGLYLEKLLSPLNVKITKLNRGLSTGSDLEYADQTTLINALKYRH